MAATLDRVAAQMKQAKENFRWQVKTKNRHWPLGDILAPDTTAARVPLTSII